MSTLLKARRHEKRYLQLVKFIEVVHGLSGKVGGNGERSRTKRGSQLRIEAQIINAVPCFRVALVAPDIAEHEQTRVTAGLTGDHHLVGDCQ